MNSRLRHAASSLLGVLIAITLLLAYPEVNQSRAKARAVAPAADLRAATTDTVPGKVTLYNTTLKTSDHFFRWAEKHSYCGAPILFPVDQDYIPGSIVAGYAHRYDKGAIVFGCPDGSNTVYRGSVWFDLSDITSKAPPLHLSVQTATLHFRASYSCPNVELLVGTADWMKGYPDNTLVPGDPNPIAKFYPTVTNLPLVEWPAEGMNVDVKAVVSNWLRGEEHGGYANYGFVFKGGKEADVEYKDADACVGRFWDFSLTVNYTYDTETVKSVPDSYPLVCRGTDTLKIMDFDGPVPFRWVGFNFIPGTGPAKNGLRPGQCTWLNREMRPGEPARLAQPIEDTLVWNKELNSSDSYWTFYVYNAGDQLQATGSERSTKPSIDVAKPGGSIPGGDKFAIAKTNFALASNGATAKGSTTLDPIKGFDASGAINGDRAGINWGSGGGWADATAGVFPDYLEIVFKGSHTIDQINVYTLQDNYKSPVDPGDPSGMLFTKFGFGLTAFEVQIWDGGAWVTVGSVKESDPWYVGREFNFKAVTTDRIRVVTHAAVDNGYSRITEVEAWGTK